jgi:hypothetical protein
MYCLITVQNQEILKPKFNNVLVVILVILNLEQCVISRLLSINPVKSIIEKYKLKFKQAS